MTCRCVNCLTLTEEDIGDILRDLLYQFPLRELDVFLPEWVDALPGEHPIRSGLYQEIGEAASQLTRICALPPCLAALSQGENIESAAASTIDLGSGADAAIEAADVVFMTSDVAAVPQALRISRQTARIAWQNVVFALAVKLAVMILGLCGYASMWLAVIADSGVALLCVLNSIRILYKK